jgi:glycyl-tRNA synthetase alpha subunit
MEVTQFPRIVIGGIECKPVPLANNLFYLERSAMYMQGVDSIYDSYLDSRPLAK